MKIGRFVRVARLAAGASLLIGLGDYVLLKIGTPIGPFLFAFGLLGVCVLGLNLFTGKCGFLFEDGLKLSDLLVILVSNLIFGYLFGMIFGLIDAEVLSAASSKVASWDFSAEFFLKSALCGVIMYLAVAIFRKGSPFGILLGVPLFIFCGFQHSIANVITLGVTMGLDWNLVSIILLCAAGNFVGAIAAWALCKDVVIAKTK
ncbi:formate/nitrite transporter family protein [Candidatus Saccharibacteria bacterium]|nr:formate/nitrite transporter family protein [Candidatus Saccharibacteria bacterium]